MAQLRQRRRPLAEINVVPYIDVMLVLLVIFMITAPLLSQGIHVNLPQAQAKALPHDKVPIILSVNQQGQYFLNISDHPETPLSNDLIEQQVQHALAAAQQQHEVRNVYVKGDQHVNYGKVVAAMVLLQQAGAADVGLITEPVNK